MAKKRIWLTRLACFSATFQCFQVEAQLSLSLQVRPRAEMRSGYSTLPAKHSQPAFFVSQRSRLSVQYASSRLMLRYAIQDVRVWGQDASSISNADGAKLGTHEAWAELVVSNRKDSTFRRPFVEWFSIRTGRQELVYDDQRLLGNLDWLQQGRRHDAIVARLKENNWKADIGVAFNQNTDAINYNGTSYTPANVLPYVKDSRGNLAPTPAGMIPLTSTSGLSNKTGSPAVQGMPSTNKQSQEYKSMQFIYVSKALERGKLSALVFADQFGRSTLDSVRNFSGTDTGYVYGLRFNSGGVYNRVTAGLFLSDLAFNPAKKITITLGAWYQGGKNRDGVPLSGFMTTAAVTWISGRISCTAGWDYLSGNNTSDPDGKNHRFDPLYGTPHKFWGQMDFFYAASGSPEGGLNNPYLKVLFTGKDKRFTAGVDYHFFSLAGNQLDANRKTVKKYLGSEFDLLARFAVNKWATIESGMGLMTAGPSMAYAKSQNPAAVRNTGTWAYLTLNVKADQIFR